MGKESNEQVLECKKVKEIIERNGEKEWVVSKRSEDLVRATEKREKNTKKEMSW